MDKKRFERIKENVNIRCTIANATGIGMTFSDKEELELIDEVERLNNIIKEVRDYIEKHKNMTQGTFNSKEWVEQYFELVCDPKELLEILDKENQNDRI